MRMEFMDANRDGAKAKAKNGYDVKAKEVVAAKAKNMMRTKSKIRGVDKSGSPRGVRGIMRIVGVCESRGLR
jgi:hypothetical protein